MLVLVIDTATPAITTAVVSVDADDVSVLAERVTVDARAHGEMLAPGIAAVLGEVGKVAADLDAVVAGVGPGPFTGLRVGLVTALALADTHSIPGYGVCTLDAIDIDAGCGTIFVATDARRKEVYWAVYRDGERIDGPSVARPADIEIPAEVEATAGEGAFIYADVFQHSVLGWTRYPSARSLAWLARERVLARAPGEPLTPLYLRRPDAVEPGPRKAVS